MNSFVIQLCREGNNSPIGGGHIIFDDTEILTTRPDGVVKIRNDHNVLGHARHTILAFDKGRCRPSIITLTEQFFDSADKHLVIRLKEYPKRPIDGVGWGLKAIGGPIQNGRFDRSDVKVGILDTGVDCRHPCLNVAGGVCVYTAISHGFSTKVAISHHGTFCAGLIGGLVHAADGIAGVVPGMPLIDIQVQDPKTSAISSDSIIEGLYWAASNNIDVLNVGFASTVYDSNEEKAYKEAWEAGVIVVAPVGNTDSDDTDVMYPARYPYTVAVSGIGRVEDATGIDADAPRSVDQQYFFPSVSCCGSQVDVTAPATEIMSVLRYGEKQQWSYDSCIGTSEATCYVTGVVAALLENSPRTKNIAGWHRPERVRRLLHKYAKPLGIGRSREGAGLVQLPPGITMQNVEECPR